LSRNRSQVQDGRPAQQPFVAGVTASRGGTYVPATDSWSTFQNHAEAVGAW